MRKITRVLVCFVLATVIVLNSGQKAGAETYVANHDVGEAQTCVYIEEEIKQTSQSSGFGRVILIAISAGAGSVSFTMLLLNVLKDDNDKEDQKK